MVSAAIPVMLPPGRLMLATRPPFTGSVTIGNTIGIVVVAAFAATTETLPPAATITATCLRTNSAAIAGRRAY
jgi:hypothetical protein